MEVPDAFVPALPEAFAGPAVALVPVRAVECGCFLYELRRGRPGAKPCSDTPAGRRRNVRH